ncbi:MAG: alpha/beta hydrolase [Verrucomicrobiota bacterium]
MPNLQTNRLKISFQQRGSGPDLIMIHGLAANQAFWHFKIMPHFVEDFHVTVYDLRGHGLSEMLPEGYVTKDLAEDLLSMMDQLEIEKAHLVGHSYGGAVSLHFAAMCPNRVQSLSLIDCRVQSLQPMHGFDDINWWHDRKMQIEAKGVTIPEGTPKVVYAMLEELIPMIESGDANTNALPGLILNNGSWDGKSRSAKRWMKLVQETTFTNDFNKVAELTSDLIESITARVLLLYGGESQCLDTCIELQKLLPEAKVVIAPNLGHFFPMVRPDVVVDHVRNFILGNK